MPGVRCPLRAVPPTWTQLPNLRHGIWCKSRFDFGLCPSLWLRGNPAFPEYFAFLSAPIRTRRAGSAPRTSTTPIGCLNFSRSSSPAGAHPPAFVRQEISGEAVPYAFLEIPVVREPYRADMLVRPYTQALVGLGYAWPVMAMHPAE